ncbi:M15 family metallopeptidase [Rubrobacter aplysinae]|uniref:M15 family metallopeptidase n=1 Tax=Rubrobacter aplysinae TaxID=909625 RepID=UPI00069E839F|nr:M15 family metallopeptidase [Rubrobacter aplysinae]
MLVSGAGCAAEIPSSLGNIESSRDSGPDKDLPATVPEQSSEWEAIREVYEPYWARNSGSGGTALPDRQGSNREGAETGEGDKVADATDASDAADASPAGSPDELLVVVDRHNGLPPGYEPDKLVLLHPRNVPTLGGGSMKLREPAARAASRMIGAARKDGIELLVSSAYRSYEAQVVSYGRLTAIYGERAKNFSAPPGHSEHQLGTVIDVSNSDTNYRLIQHFGETAASEWLHHNAASYGFVLSYPREAEEHTGYSWEPWHYRYIGKENARLYEEGDYASPQSFFRERSGTPETE